MPRHSVLAVALLAASLLALRAQQPKPVVKEILDLAKELADGKDISPKAAVLKKKFPTVTVAMQIYNERAKGGVGYGPKGRRIERALIDLADDGITAERLKAEAEELQRLAHVNMVMAEVVRGFAPAKPFQGRGKKEWERDLAALKAASGDLLKAVKDGDPKAVRTAATKINQACNSCHDGDK